MTARDPAAALLVFLALFCPAVCAPSALPYPRSTRIERLVWHWDTHAAAAPGSDLWPLTWGPDGDLYTAWGDGGGFGGSDRDGRVSLGFARISAGPQDFRGVNINGGKHPLHATAFPDRGKTAGLLYAGDVLYALVNLQDGPWPAVDHVLAWSADRGATWAQAGWHFPKGAGNFQPAQFLNFGRDYAGVPPALAGFVYLVGPNQPAAGGKSCALLLARTPLAKLREPNALEYFAGADAAGQPQWSPRHADARPIFSDPQGVALGSLAYHPLLQRYLLAGFHTGPGQLGVFDAPAPWGPWTTIAYENNWGGMGCAGEGLTCSFPQKWMSADGLTLGCVFSVYGDGAKLGIQAHDQFNLVMATLLLAHPATTR
jgi:hypothetical protein